MLDKNFKQLEASIESGVQYTAPLAAFAADLTDINLPRGIHLDADGTVELLYANGSSDTLQLASGVTHPFIGFTQVVASSLLVSQIHIVY